ncbi:hypothetical protein [Yersinia proxima]|uniref:hypothetical protein n=1 Tax=Yersinia proxima TaxID=2890316 RepID=UPI000980C3F5|nr:hypothetical protein [Yersinia proxima]
MSGLLTSIKLSVKPSLSDYIPPTLLNRRSEPLQYSTQSYSKKRFSETIETTMNRDKVVREIVTTERIDAVNNKIIKIKTFDAATNKINSVIQKFDSANNMNASVARTYDYDPINKKVILTGKVKVTQKFDAKNNMIERVEKKFNAAGEIINESLGTAILNNSVSDINQLADSINSFPTKEINPASGDTMISSHLNIGPRNLVPVMNYASRL